MQTEGSYYTSIDGIRAIAVLLVLFFHAGISRIPGGFIGVDVFFVISGFLITSNIIRDIDSNNFSLRKFYSRRIARLLPALFVTILITLILGSLLFSPNQLEHLANSAFATGLIVSNIFFWLDSGYFSPAAETLPLLHTWSLGVEEQFYLFWPLLLLLFLSKLKRLSAILVVILFYLVSVLLSLLYYPQDINAVFYLLPFRIHEFALGAFIALMGPLKSDSLRAIIAIVSLWAILFFALTVKGSIDGVHYEMIYPSLAAAGLIFGAGSNELRPLLSSRALVWIGKRSYSIYLVHWPIGVFLAFAFLDFGSSAYYAPIVIVLSILLGALLHLTVEKKYRLSSSDTEEKSFKSLAVTAIFLIAIFSISTIYRIGDGIPQRLSEEIQQASILFDGIMSETTLEIDRENCEIRGYRLPVEQFSIETCLPFTEEGRSYLVLGDSLAANSFLIFRKGYPEIEFGRLTIPGCPIKAPGNFSSRVSAYCEDYYNFAFEELMSTAILEGVIISSAWPEPYSELNELARVISDKGLRTIVVGEYMEFYNDIPDLVLSSIRIDSVDAKIRLLEARHSYRIGSELHASLDENIEFVNMIDYQCNPQCDVLDEDSRLLYLDSNHISSPGAELFAARLRNANPNLF